MYNSWGTIEKMAKDRQKWRAFVAALHANGSPGRMSVNQYIGAYS